MEKNGTTIEMSVAQVNRRQLLSGIFLFALTLRIANLLFLSQAPFFEYKIGDAARYDAWAHEIASGNWFGSEVFYQAPLYPYFLALIYSTVGDDVLIVKLIQAGLASLACTFVAAAAWNFFNRRAAWIAGIVMACYVPSLFLESILQKSILDLIFISSIIWLVSRIYLKSSWKNWLGLGTQLGLLCLTRENALALIPLFGFAALVHCRAVNAEKHESWRTSQWFQQVMSNSFKTVPVFALGVAIVLVPVGWRNHHLGGEFHITTSQLGPNFYIGNHDGADGFYRPLVFGHGDAKHEQADAVALAEKEMGRKLTAGEVSNYYLDESKRFIQQDTKGWLQLLGKKTLLSVNATEIVDTEDQYVYQAHSPVLFLLSPVFHFGLLLPIALIAIWYQRHRWRDLWLLFAMAGIFQLTLVAFFVFGRYRFPVVPIFVCLASPLLADGWLWLKAQQRNWHPQANQISEKIRFSVFAAVAIAMIVVCHLPVISTNGQESVTYNNFAIQSLIRNELGLAEAYVEKSLERDADFALAHNSKGVLHRERGELRDARYHFHVALELEPEYQNARQNLEAVLNK